MENEKTELKMIRMSEIEAQEIKSVYPVRETDYCTGRPGGWKDDNDIKSCGTAFKGEML